MRLGSPASPSSRMRSRRQSGKFWVVNKFKRVELIEVHKALQERSEGGPLLSQRPGCEPHDRARAVSVAL